MKITDEGFWSIVVSIIIGCVLIIAVMSTISVLVSIYENILERDIPYCECLDLDEIG